MPYGVVSLRFVTACIPASCCCPHSQTTLPQRSSIPPEASPKAICSLPNSLSGFGCLHLDGVPALGVVVIDALYKCDNQENITLILRPLVSDKDVSSLGIRIFVRSGPEIPIRSGFRDIDQILHQDLRLEQAA
jgi:hypothetical protein